MLSQCIHAIAEFLEAIGRLDDDVIASIDGVLIRLWKIEDEKTRTWIIQEAAIMAGLVREDDVD